MQRLLDWWNNRGLSEPVITLRRMLLEDEWDVFDTLHTKVITHIAPPKIQFGVSCDEYYPRLRAIKKLAGCEWMTHRERKVIIALVCKRCEDAAIQEKQKQRKEFAHKIGAPYEVA